MRRLVALALCALLGCAGSPPAPMKSDWQVEQEKRDWLEHAPAALPPFPKTDHLLEFDVAAVTSFRFFIDASTLSVGSDGVVRYVLVARSPSGAQNVSYEGIRCKGASYRLYATGRRDGTWTASRDDSWRPIRHEPIDWRRALSDDYFCPRGGMIASAAEGIDALKRGGNPAAAGDSRPTSGN
ncbi:MAG TPA: CNP1-like family protein [Burkholderiales bacterium]|nr:CNP1-like family protein [Burkholderiales bacterium]